ncbi:MAG: hypothetical protein ABSH28_14385 [Acidobacteriota bacterium]|jgi:hypothetical protein
MVELVAFFAVGTLVLIFDYASMYETAASPGLGATHFATHFDALTISVVVTVVLLVNILMRFDGYWREDGSPYGFCEWVFRRRRPGTPMRKPACAN